MRSAPRWPSRNETRRIRIGPSLAFATRIGPPRSASNPTDPDGSEKAIASDPEKRAGMKSAKHARRWKRPAIKYAKQWRKCGQPKLESHDLKDDQSLHKLMVLAIHSCARTGTEFPTTVGRKRVARRTEFPSDLVETAIPQCVAPGTKGGPIGCRETESRLGGMPMLQ